MPIQNRYELMGLLACTWANPNGDPDAGNLPRVDPQTSIGYITDAAIKRRVRDYVSDVYGDQPGMQLFVQRGSNLNKQIALAREQAGVAMDDKKSAAVNKSRDKACEMFYDVRTFGAVMSTGPNDGQTRGPVQVSIATSVDPVNPMDIGISRTAIADDGKEKDSKKKDVAYYQDLEDKMDDDKKHTLGRKQLIPFGLYQIHVCVSAFEAEKTGFSDRDFEVLCEALANMWEHACTASKGEMTLVSPLIIFKHVGLGNNPDDVARSAKLGCSRRDKLFELVDIKKKDGVEAPRSYADYDVTVNISGRPDGVDIGFQPSFEGVTWNQLPASETWMKSI